MSDMNAPLVGADGVISNVRRRLHGWDRGTAVLLWLNGEAPVEHLDVGEYTLPVGTLHAHHVFHVKQRRYVRLLPARKQTPPSSSRFAEISYHMSYSFAQK